MVIDTYGRKREGSRLDSLRRLRFVIYFNHNEELYLPEVEDCFREIEDLDQLKTLKLGGSLWEQDTELSPYGGVCGFTRLQLKGVTPYDEGVHIAYGGFSNGERDITEQSVEGLFQLKNPKGLAALIRTHGDHLTTVEGLGPNGLSRNYQITAGEEVFERLGVPDFRRLGLPLFEGRGL